MVGIQKIENKLTHSVYIGQSTNILKRKWAHIHAPSKASLIDQRIQEYGEENFSFEILEECKPEELDDREIYWINYYNSYDDGYNMTKGGQSQFGEKNIQAKLTEKQVKEIISLLENTNESCKSIGEKYNVHRNMIDYINRCKNWNQLHEYKENIRKEARQKRNENISPYVGEHNIKSILTSEQVLHIIKLLESDKRSIAQLSRDLNISINIIYDINRCKTWKHLHNYKKNIRNESKEVR